VLKLEQLAISWEMGRLIKTLPSILTADIDTCTSLIGCIHPYPQIFMESIPTLSLGMLYDQIISKCVPLANTCRHLCLSSSFTSDLYLY